MSSKTLRSNKNKLDKLLKVIERKKGRDIEVFDVGELSSITDYFIISTALNRTHLKTLRDEVVKNIKIEKSPGIDGRPESGWIVLDYGDFIVHLMVEGERDYYNLEDLWGNIAKSIYHG